MGRLFLVGIAVGVILLLLFFPIFLSLNVHYDLNRKKFCFSLNLYKKIKLIGGYVAPCPKGIALHVSEQKAILVQYTEMESERKKFSFFKTMRLYRLTVVTETGADYLLGVYFLSLLGQILGVIKEGSANAVKTGVWLVNGDVLRISARVVWLFNGCTILKEWIRVLKEKIKYLWKKKARKSIV